MGPVRSIGIVEPRAPAVGGNAITAERWARVFERLGWRAFRMESWDGGACDALVALHARKSHDSVVRFRRERPDGALIVAGTGTDLYTDIPDSGEVRESLGLATRVVVLQPLAIDALPEEVRPRARVIYQSVVPPVSRPEPASDAFEVCLLANLRPVKDPLCAPRATRLLPDESRVRLVHLGGAIDPELGAEVERESAANPRYRWLGERPHAEALETLSRSRLMVSTSRHEGGANAVSEALACDVPVLASRIPGTLGLLGEDYPGVYPVGDAHALAELLRSAEIDPGFYAALRAACRAQAWITDPETELERWQELLGELFDEAPAPSSGAVEGAP